MQGLAQDFLYPQPHRGGVPVPGQVHHARHEPPVDVLAQEQPGLPVSAQPEHRERDGSQFLHRDLEQLFPRVTLQDLGQVLAVVAARGHPGLFQHAGQLAPQHRDPGDALVVGGMRVEAEEPVFAVDLAARVDPLDRDVVQVGAPVHGGPGIGLGQDEPLRILGPRAHLGRQRGEG